MLYPKYLKCQGFKLSKKDKQLLCESLTKEKWIELITLTNEALVNEDFDILPIYEKIPNYTKLK